MGLLENVADSIVSQLEDISDRLERLEQRSEYNTDIKMLKAEEVAEKIGVSQSHIYKMMRQGDIPFVKAGRKKLIPRRKLIKWIENNTEEDIETNDLLVG